MWFTTTLAGGFYVVHQPWPEASNNPGMRQHMKSDSVHAMGPSSIDNPVGAVDPPERKFVSDNRKTWGGPTHGRIEAKRTRIAHLPK